MEDKQQSEEDIKKLIKATMLVFDIYQKEHQATVQQMQALDQQIRQNLNELENKALQTTEASQKQLAINIEQIIEEKLENKMADFGKNLQARTNQLQEAFDHFASERRHLARQTWIISWKGVLGMAVGMAIMVIASFTATWNEKKKRDAMFEEYRAAKVQTQMIDVENKLIKSQCGDNVCIKIDPKAGNWGDDADFVVPVLK